MNDVNIIYLPDMTWQEGHIIPAVMYSHLNLYPQPNYEKHQTNVQEG